jgi:hypothetical protein
MKNDNIENKNTASMATYLREKRAIILIALSADENLPQLLNLI